MGRESLDLPDAASTHCSPKFPVRSERDLRCEVRWTAAQALAHRALDQLIDLDDERRIYPLRVEGMVALYVGRLDDGFRTHAEMHRLASEHDRPYETGMALLGLAQSRTYAGDPIKARTSPKNNSASSTARQPVDAVSGLVRPSRGTVHHRSSTRDRALPTRYRFAESAGSTFVEGIALVGLASLLGRSEATRHCAPVVPIDHRSLASDGSVAPPVDDIAQSCPAVPAHRQMGVRRRTARRDDRRQLRFSSHSAPTLT